MTLSYPSPDKHETVGEWLEELKDADISTETDALRMQNMLRKIGFHNAICVLGIVYLEGQGTVDEPPTSIHSVAKMLIDVVKESKSEEDTKSQLP